MTKIEHMTIKPINHNAMKTKTLKPKDRPSGMATAGRLVPMLPEWMVAKLIEAKELFNHCNTCMGDCLIWNHAITLALDEIHDITFSILDNTEMPGNLKKEVDLIVEVYQTLQTIYREYGHPLTIVSMQTDDFGMYLPDSFYEPLAEKGKSERSFRNPRSIKRVIKRIIARPSSRMSDIKHRVNELGKTFNLPKRAKLMEWYKKRLRRLKDCDNVLKAVLEPLLHEYHSELMWDSIDLYMAKGRGWTREFCVKWGLDDDVENLKKLDVLRPVIDNIIKKTRYAGFAFGVKPRGTTVAPCNYVNAD